MGPEGKETRTHLFSVPFPYAVKDTPEHFMADWLTVGKEQNLTFSIRAMRNSWWRIGLPQHMGCNNLLTVRPLVGTSPDLRPAAMCMVDCMVRELHDRGLTKPVDLVEADCPSDHESEADDEVQFSMYGVTMYLNSRREVTGIRAVDIGADSAKVLRFAQVKYYEGVDLQECLGYKRRRRRPRCQSQQRTRSRSKAQRRDQGGGVSPPDSHPASSSSQAPLALPPPPHTPPPPSLVQPPPPPLVQPPPPVQQTPPPPPPVLSQPRNVPDMPLLVVKSDAQVSLASVAGVVPSLRSVASVLENDVDFGGDSDDVVALDYSESALCSQVSEAVGIAASTRKWLQGPELNFAGDILCMNQGLEANTLVYPHNQKERTEVVFCITTYKRSHQLLKALPLNLALSWPYRNRAAWVVVDFNEAPEETAFIVDTLRRLCPASVAHGHLRYFEAKDDGRRWTGWHASVAKNTAHVAGLSVWGLDVVLCNIDGDNIVTPSFIEDLLEKAPKMTTKRSIDASAGSSGGVSPADFMPVLPDIVGVSYVNPKANSTTGRIALGARVFKLLGGYRQDFGPMGFQDVDLSRRLAKLGRHCRVDSDVLVGNAILNHMEDVPKRHRREREVAEKIRNVDKSKWQSSWYDMNDSNMKKSKEAISAGRLVANDGVCIGLDIEEMLFRGEEPEPQSEPPTAPPPPFLPAALPTPFPPAAKCQGGFALFTMGIRNLAATWGDRSSASWGLRQPCPVAQINLLAPWP